MTITYFSIITLALCGAVGLGLGKHLEKTTLIQQSPEVNIEYRKRFGSRMWYWIALIAFFIVFIFVDDTLDQLLVSEYFVWKKESMHVFATVMIAFSVWYDYKSTQAIDMPGDVKKTLGYAKVIMLISILILFSLFVMIMERVV